MPNGKSGLGDRTICNISGKVGQSNALLSVNLTSNPVTDCCLTIRPRSPRSPLLKGSRGVGGVGQEASLSPPS